MFICWYEVTDTKADISGLYIRHHFFISSTSPRNVAARILRLAVFDGKRLTESVQKFIKICIVNTRVPTDFTRNIIVCVYNYKLRDEVKF